MYNFEKISFNIKPPTNLVLVVIINHENERN